MRSWVQLALFTAGIVTAVTAATPGCGGNVVIDGKQGTAGDSGSAGAGGQGGATTSISSNDAVTVSTGTTTFDGTFTTSVGPMTSTSTGPSTCDNTGMCGEGGSEGCITCSIMGGPCTDAYNTCFSTDACTQYNDCLSSCMTPTCQSDCAQKFPEGATQYNALITCVICDTCPNDCSQYTQFCNN